MKIIANTAAVLLLLGGSLASCDSMSNTSKGYVVGSVGGTVLGAGIGALLGGDYGADVGSSIGMAVGGVAGAAIGAEQDAKIERESRRATATVRTSDDDNTYYDDSTGLYYTKVSEDDSILFGPRSCDLNGAACRQILRISAILNDLPFSGIVIYGSTDDTESRDYSMELSQERADVVAEYFQALGFRASLISAIGLGSEYPVADNSTLDGRAKNRCVEVYIINKDN